MVVALAGGVGGAKLSQGLAQALPPEDVSVVVNTADDFDLWGLRVCPDLDTVMYTLAGMANAETGWGVENETWSALDMLGRYGEDTWFRIGDRDLATHVIRTRLLREGLRLTQVTRRLSTSLGVRSNILPMSDQAVSTVVGTPEGDLDFQDYFVRRHHSPVVTGVRFGGIERAQPTVGALRALAGADLVVFCPSNPIVSVGPILALPGVREALQRISAPVVAVSPIVGGEALRGPAGEMLRSLGHEVSALGVARLYKGVAQGFVVDEADAGLEAAIGELDMRVLVTDTVMREESDRRRLARETVEFGRSLNGTDEAQR